jgi:formiminotetrahydrofolate cyclodeaminase
MLADVSAPAWLSDAAAGAQLSLAAVAAAHYNVLVNTAAIEDEEFTSEQRGRAADLLERARSSAARVEAMLMDSL